MKPQGAPGGQPKNRMTASGSLLSVFLCEFGTYLCRASAEAPASSPTTLLSSMSWRGLSGCHTEREVC